jgi:hypothetical protein
MGISQTTTAILLFLTGLLPASCHMNSVQQKPASTIVTNAVVAKSFNGNLGEISLTNHTDTCLLLANGESCTLTPKMINGNNMRITLAVESKNDYGETHNFSVTEVMAKPGKPLEVAIGDLNLTFTPSIVSE